MVSRENRIQLAALGVAVVVLGAFAAVLPDDPGPEWIGIFVLVFYAIAFGGAHAYLYLQGEGGAVPHSARGRFLVTLGLVLPLWAGAAVVQGRSIAGIDVPIAMGALSAVLLLVYFVNEVRLGYAESRSAAD